jgi:hypothetical protein
MSRWMLFMLVCTTIGCAVRKPAPDTWRLVRQGTGRTLIPPGVGAAELSARTFKVGITRGRAACSRDTGPVRVRRRGKKLEVTVARDPLLQEPPRWLNQWTAGLETQGCIAPGEGWKLAVHVVESLPLDPNRAYHLLNDQQTGYRDVGPQNRLQVNSPIVLEGTSRIEHTIQSVEVEGHTVNVGLKADPNLLGFESAWYDLVPKAGRPGFTITPRSAERHIQGRTERAAAPSHNYLQFSPDAAYYRLVYKADETIRMLGATDRTELDRLTKAIDTDSGACEKAAGFCISIPRGVAVNSDVLVKVNGRDVELPAGATVMAAVHAGGGKDAEILPQLSVQRVYGGIPKTVEFDRSEREILMLPLMGGEIISW